MDATSIGREGATHTPLVLNHLKSYEHMGKAGARSFAMMASPLLCWRYNRSMLLLNDARCIMQ